jgi:hypothetical protein
MRTLYPSMQVLRCAAISSVHRFGSIFSGLALLGKVRSYTIEVVLAVLAATSFAQETSQTSAQASVNTILPVNWLYGAYIPKDAPRVALNGEQRFKLYIRQTFTTPGI